MIKNDNDFFGQIDVLPEIVEAVRGSGVEVYADDGVRLGTDVLKALALGAGAVFVGRPVIWGLAYNVCICQISLKNIQVIDLKNGLYIRKRGKFLKKLWCCVGGSIVG